MSATVIAFPTATVRPSSRLTQSDVQELMRWATAAEASGYYLDEQCELISEREDHAEYVVIDHDRHGPLYVVALGGQFWLEDFDGNPRSFPTLRDALEAIAPTLPAGHSVHRNDSVTSLRPVVDTEH